MSYKRVPILIGDTIQGIAARELGDGGLWGVLQEANNLATPYIIALGASMPAGGRVLREGDYIVVPTNSDALPALTDAERFGADIAISPLGALVLTDSGDLSLVEGLANLRQAIHIRLMVAPGELIYHTDYGCHVFELLGVKNNPVVQFLALHFVRNALLADDRISLVKNLTVRNDGDQLPISGDIVPAGGSQTFPIVSYF